MLETLQQACEQRNLPQVYSILSDHVQGYSNKNVKPRSDSVVVTFPIKKSNR